jgi:putative tryptophan/tyrosine transport system substrate-binding protein
VRRLTSLVLLAAVPLWAGCGGGDPAETARDDKVIGIVRAVRSTEGEVNQAAFLAELASLGYTEGRNLTVHGRDVDEVHAEPAAAEAVVRRWAAGRLDLVVALSSAGAVAAARAVPDRPVVFLSNDPVAAGLVREERHPDRNLTGATFRVPADRTLDLARRATGGRGRIGFLFPSEDRAAAPVVEASRRAAEHLGIDLAVRSFATTEDLPEALAQLRADGAVCVVAANAPATARNLPALAAAAEAAGLPVVANTAADFALIVLQPDAPELYRQMARQVARLLAGVAPAEVPVEDPARFRFSLNLAVAARLGIEVPADVVQLADTVIRP